MEARAVISNRGVKICRALCLMLLSIFHVAAFADGGNSGGGGGGISCLGRTPSLHLLEFWEAENALMPFQQPLVIDRNEKDSVDEQIAQAIQRLKNVNHRFGEDVEKTYQDIINPDNHRLDTRPDMNIQPPTDTLQPFFPEGCDVVGLGSYNDLINVLSYDKDMFRYMPRTDQAGFWLHESIYKTIRKGRGPWFKDFNSIETRKIVAHLFSKDQPLLPISTKPVGSLNSYTCSRTYVTGHSNGTRFYLHRFNDRVVFVPEHSIHQLGGVDAATEYFSFIDPMILTGHHTIKNDLFLKSIYVVKGAAANLVVDDHMTTLKRKMANGQDFTFSGDYWVMVESASEDGDSIVRDYNCRAY